MAAAQSSNMMQGVSPLLRNLARIASAKNQVLSNEPDRPLGKTVLQRSFCQKLKKEVKESQRLWEANLFTKVNSVHPAYFESTSSTSSSDEESDEDTGSYKAAAGLVPAVATSSLSSSPVPQTPVGVLSAPEKTDHAGPILTAGSVVVAAVSPQESSSSSSETSFVVSAQELHTLSAHFNVPRASRSANSMPAPPEGICGSARSPEGAQTSRSRSPSGAQFAGNGAVERSRSASPRRRGKTDMTDMELLSLFGGTIPVDPS